MPLGFSSANRAGHGGDFAFKSKHDAQASELFLTANAPTNAASLYRLRND